MIDKNISSFFQPIMIISGEGIRRLTELELINLREFFLKYFDRVRIVAYVRKPKSYLESSFQQSVQGGMNYFNLNKIYPNYRDLFEKFDNVFGKENVTIWKFDPNRFPQ